MGGATKDYNFKKKNDWRGWVWNRVVERLAVRGIEPRDATVLGLFGADALDVESALKRGFRLENLISVEKDRAAVKAQRGLGMNVIEGRLSDVLVSWSDQEINFVYADMCAGVNIEAIASYTGCIKAFRWINGCVAFNLLRGRETKGSHNKHMLDFRDKLIQHPDEEMVVDPKHRGALSHFNFLHMFYEIVAMWRWCQQRDVEEEEYPLHLVKPEAERLFTALDAGLRFSNPALFSYRSGKTLRFDSVVFNWRLSPFGARKVFFQPGAIDEYLSLVDEVADVIDVGFAEHYVKLMVQQPKDYEASVQHDDKMRKRIAAAKAVRTARLNQRGAN